VHRPLGYLLGLRELIRSMCSAPRMRELFRPRSVSGGTEQVPVLKLKLPSRPTRFPPFAPTMDRPARPHPSGADEPAAP